MVMNQLIHTLMRAIFIHVKTHSSFFTPTIFCKLEVACRFAQEISYVTVPVLRDKLKLILPVTLNQAQSPTHKYGHCNSTLLYVTNKTALNYTGNKISVILTKWRVVFMKND